MAIARGRFSHSILDDFRCLIEALLVSNKNHKNRDAFEKTFANYMGREKSIAFPLARTALYCTLKSLNLPQGSKILMPSITIKAMLDVVVDLKLTPIFVDSNAKEAFIDLNSLETILAKNPDIKVAFLTYLFGTTPELNEIFRILKSKKIVVIEDFSQNLNSSYSNKKLGTFGDVAIYSTSSLKTLDLHGGGMFLCENDNLFKAVQNEQSKLNPPVKKTLILKILKCLIKNIASTGILFNFITFPIIRVSSRFSDSAFSRLVGSRSKEPISTLPSEWFVSFSEAQAKFGLRAIRKVEMNDLNRLEVASKYNEMIKGLLHIQGSSNGESRYWQYLVFPKDVKKFRKKMLKSGIDTAQTSLINISNLKGYGFDETDTPISKFIYEQGVYIPIYAGLTVKQTNKIIAELNEYDDSQSILK